MPTITGEVYREAVEIGATITRLGPTFTASVTTGEGGGGLSEAQVRALAQDVVDDDTTLTRDSELTAHAADTTNVHGIADTSALATSASVSTVAGNLATETARAQAAEALLQPLDSDLTAIAALTTTSYGRAFLALADAAAGRTVLGLGTAATSATSAFDAAGAAAAVSTALTAARPAPIVKASDQSYTSTDTLTDDTELTFTALAGERWLINTRLLMYGPTAADFSVGILLPTGATALLSVLGPSNSYAGTTASGGQLLQGFITASNTKTGIIGTVPAATGFGLSIVTIEGVVTIGGTGGSVTVQHCQSTSNGTATVVRANSYLERTRCP